MKFRIPVWLAFAFGALHAEDSPEPRLLDLNVIAVDNRGQPVSDLTVDDFLLTDAGKQQKIALFRHIDNTLWQPPKLAPSELSNRSSAAIPHATVILFDLMNEGFGTRGVAANQIIHCLENLEKPDYVYVYILTVEGRLFAVHGLPEGEEGSEPGAASWNKQIKLLMDKSMRMVTRSRPFEVDVAVRVQLTFAALDALGWQLSRVAGRKNVVWVTDGVPIELGPGRSDTGDFVDFTPELRRLSEALVRSGMALYPVRQVMFGSGDSIGETSGGAGATGGAGTGMQSLATLNELAGVTGGRPSVDKDTGAALKQAMSDVNVSYQIGYYPPESNWDGKFHKLRVTCKRKGVRVQAKTGYYAWVGTPGAGSEQAIRSVAGTEFDAAEIGLRGTLSADPKDKRAAHWSVRIDARDIALAQQGDHYDAQLRLALVGYFADGRIESSQIIPLDLHYSAEERERVLKEGIGFSRNLTITDQLSKMRLIVYDRGSNAVGSLTIPLNPSIP